MAICWKVLENIYFVHFILYLVHNLRKILLPNRSTYALI